MLLMHDPQLTVQCQHYEHEVKKEDAAGLSGNEDGDGNQVVKMRLNGSVTTVFPVKERVEKPVMQQQNGFNTR